MPLVDLVHPGNLPSEVVISTAGSNLKQIGRGDDTEDMVLKTIGASFKFWSPLIETTGDGDTVPIHENNGLLYGVFSLTGMMVQTIALGLQNLATQSYSTAAPSRFKMKFALDATTAVGTAEVDVAIEVVQFRYKSTAASVPVQITGKYSNYTLAQLEVT